MGLTESVGTSSTPTVWADTFAVELTEGTQCAPLTPLCVVTYAKRARGDRPVTSWKVADILRQVDASVDGTCTLSHAGHL